MLRSDLVEVVNSRRAWAMIGSGTSAGAGLPGWKRLVEVVLESLPNDEQSAIKSDPRFRVALPQENFPECFSRIEAVIGRADLEARVRASIGAPVRRSRLLTELVDWPFEGFITTNYDGLIQEYLTKAGHGGWATVGNAASELPQLMGDVSNVVWHMHGAAGHGPDASRLVLTTEDYEATYLDGSPASEHLRSLLSTRRLIIVGFGLADMEVMRVLRRIGLLANPTQPVFALMPEYGDLKERAHRLELLERYNVDVIGYRDPDGDHRALADLVQTYGSFVLRRSLEFGRPQRECPSYDPETTGLLIFNELGLRRTFASSDETLDALTRALLLGLIAASEGVSRSDLIDELENRIALMARDTAIPHLARALDSLLEEGLVEDRGDAYWLSASGNELAIEREGATKRRSAQFSSALLARASVLIDDSTAATRVATAAEGFLKECIAKRSVGMAMAAATERSTQRDYHIVALLQSLPDFFPQLTDDAEAIALVRLITGILANPVAAEKQFIGTALQARFALHLLGQDPHGVRTRLAEFQQTVFVLDSSTTIQVLAKQSPACAAATTLVENLSILSAGVATTETLAEEAAEHARWAVRQVDRASGRATTDTLSALTGRAGQSPNAFLEGFAVESAGGATVDLHDYLNDCLDVPRRKGEYRSEHIAKALEVFDVGCLSFTQWEGWVDELYYERDQEQAKIADLRKRRGNFKHERQVKAEAEALLVIKGLRHGELTWQGREVPNAFFVSHTRLLDRLDRSGPPVTIRPELALQWLSTLQPPSTAQAEALAGTLAWELEERGLTVIDSTQLGVVFGPLISASRGQLAEELEKYRQLAADRFGESSTYAFTEVNELDVPIVLQSLQAQRAAQLEVEMENTRIKRAEAAQMRLTQRERDAFELLRAKEKQRKLRTASKKRALASRKKRKKRS